MNNIKLARVNKGLTQEQVAEKLNTSRAAVSMYETGKLEANYTILKALSKLLNVSIDYLIGNDTDLVTLGSNGITVNQARELWLSTLTEIDKQIVKKLGAFNEFQKYQIFGYMESLVKA